MDPLTAIGVAASIAQFINLGIQVAARLKEYNSATTDVPKALQHISAQLPLLLRSLERVKTEIEVEKIDLDTRCILKGVVSGCMQQVQKVDRIIEKVLHVPGDSLRNKVQKVFVGLKNDDKILAIEKNLQTYISVLILHRVIQGPDAALAVNEDSSYFEVRVKKVSPFSERVELMQDLEAHLFPAATSQVQNPIVVELVGPERAGKTQLALGYCHQAKEIGQFQTIFWVNSASPENLCRSLESIADIVRQSKEGLKDRKEKINFVKSFLANRWNSWLLVLDGYDHTAFNDVMEYLPPAGSGALLFISRHGYLPDADHVVHVPMFRDADEIEHLRSLLVNAVGNDDIEKVESLLDNGADPDSRELSGWPCLHRAVKKENEPLVRLLLAKGAKSRIQGPPFSGAEGYVTALYWAASSGNTSITKLLLDHEDMAGLAPQAPGNNAILRYAAEKGREKTIRMLIEHGSVHVEGRGAGKDTPLGLAAKNGHTAVVKLLLDSEADAEVESSGATPLLLAANSNHLDVVKLLCTQGKVDVNTGFLSGDSALGVAVKTHGFGSHAWDKTVKYLLEQGADPDRYDKNKNGTPPLGVAVYRGFENVLSMLLAHGADPFPLRSQGYSPVEEAALFGHESTVNLLLQAQAKDPAIRAEQLKKAIILASIKGHRDVILALLEAGVSIDSVGYLGKTPLLHAIEEKQIPTIRLLIRRGARQDLADDNGILPIFLAADYGLDVVVTELIRNDESKKLDVRNAKGETPLCLAVAKGHKKVCQVLLERTASFNFTNKYGDTPTDLALEKGDKELVKLLEPLSHNWKWA